MEEFGIKEISRAVKKRYKILVISPLLFGISAFLHSYFSPPVYMAKGKIYMGPKNVEIRSLDEFVLADYGERILNTQVEILKSEPVLKMTAEALSLERRFGLKEGEGVDYLRRNIKVQTVENTYIIEISAHHTSPDLARDMVNMLMRSYEEFLRRSVNEDVRDALTWVTDRLHETKEKLKISEEGLIDFVKKHGVVESEGDGSKGASPSEHLKNILLEKKSELISLKSRYGEKHPLVEIKEREVKEMERLFNEERRRAIEEQEKMIKLSILRREVEANREIYNTLLRETKKIDILKNNNEISIKLLEEARKPIRPVSPRPLRSGLLGAFTGFITGLIAVFLLETLDVSIKRESEIEESFDVPVLLTIPRIEKEEVHEFIKGDHPVYEKFYQLVTLVEFMVSNPKVFQTVSWSPDEGKSLFCILFATSLAKAGHRCLIIDTDFRGSRMKEDLRVSSGKGLSDYLMNDASLREIVNETSMRDLFYISAGRKPPVSFSILLKRSFPGMIEELRKEFDFIIIDTPSLIFYSHSLEIANLSDFVILLVRANFTTKHHLKKLISTMKSVQAKAMGIVFNYAGEEKKYYYYKYYHS